MMVADESEPLIEVCSDRLDVGRFLGTYLHQREPNLPHIWTGPPVTLHFSAHVTSSADASMLGSSSVSLAERL